jgi:DNA repair protein RadC
MENDNTNTSIKCWAEDDRPREKLLNKGKHSLSDAELLAILLGTGCKGESALELARRILRKSGGNLLEMARLTVAEMIRDFKGVGEAKAVTLIAALELGNRKRASEALLRDKVSCSQDAFDFLRSFLGDSNYEEFWILILNRANRIRNKVCISEGGFSGTIADPKKIFKIALENGGSSLILAHNHPSGNTRPSDADINLTKRLKEAGKLLEMPIIDHIILGEEKYFSFADEGLL